MKREDLQEADHLRVRVTIYNKLADRSQGGVVDLTGATLACKIGAPDAIGVSGTVVPIDLVNGVVDVLFSPIGNIASSYVVAQLRATRSGEVQTVWEQAYNLLPSIV